MTKFIRTFYVALSIVLLLASCEKSLTQQETSTSESEETTADFIEKAGIEFITDGKCDFTLIRSDEDNTDAAIAQYKVIYNAVNNTVGSTISIKTDWMNKGAGSSTDAHEILYGFTNRPETAEALETVGYDGWGVICIGNKIVICAGQYANLSLAVDYFINKTLVSLTDGRLTDFCVVEGKVEYAETYICETPMFTKLYTTPQNAAVKNFDEIRAAYYDADGRLLSIAHRGDWRNYPENSLEGYASCIEAGIDIIEVDIQRTSDGVFVMCHDKTVDRTTNGSGTISDMTYEQIKALKLKKGKGGNAAALTDYSMPTLEEVFLLCRGKVLLNLDKAWDYRNEVYSLAEKCSCINICMFKGDSIATWSKELHNTGKELPLFCGSYWSDDLSGFNTYIDSLQGYAESIESGFSAKGAAPSKAEVWNYAEKCGIRGVMLTLADNYAGGFDDDQTGWAALADIGIDVIMTEYPFNLAAYIENISSVRDAKTPIRAENFNSHSGLQLNEVNSARANKTVSSIDEGDYAIYRNIDFGKGCSTFLAYAKGNVSGATIALRLDSPKGEILGVIKVGDDSSMQQYATKLKAISGIHDVCLCFDGGAENLMILEYIAFQ